MLNSRGDLFLDIVDIGCVVQDEGAKILGHQVGKGGVVLEGLFVKVDFLLDTGLDEELAFGIAECAIAIPKKNMFVSYLCAMRARRGGAVRLLSSDGEVVGLQISVLGDLSVANHFGDSLGRFSMIAEFPRRKCESNVCGFACRLPICIGGRDRAAIVRAGCIEVRRSVKT